MESYFRIGVITTTHGLKGEVKVYPTTEDPHRFEELDCCYLLDRGTYRPLTIRSVRYFKNLPVFLSDSSELEHRVAWLMPRQKATWTTSMQTKRRGIAFMETIGASSGDGFGLCTETLDYPLPKPPMIVVYPKVYPVDAGILVENSSSMLPFDRGCVEDDTLFKGIHDYQHGDSIKHINWRILAHQGELAVNEYQYVAIAQAIQLHLRAHIALAEGKRCGESG